MYEFPGGNSFHEVRSGNYESESGTSRPHTEFPRHDSTVLVWWQRKQCLLFSGICVYIFLIFSNILTFFSNIFEFFFDFLETSTVDPYDEPRPLLVKHQQFS